MSRIPLLTLVSVLSVVASSSALAAPSDFSEHGGVRAEVALERDGAGPTLLSPSSRRPHFGGYVGPSFGVTGINGHAAFDGGLRGAFIIEDRLGIGLAGYAMGWDGQQGDNRELSRRRALAGAYGGLLLEYRLLPQFPVHGLIDATFGGGFVCTDLKKDAFEDDDDNDDGKDDCRQGRGFGMIEPTANIEMNLTRFMRLSVGGGYRFAFARERDGISGQDLSGLTMRTNLQFGWF